MNTNDITNRLTGLTVEQAYQIGRVDGRAEMLEAIDASKQPIKSEEEIISARDNVIESGNHFHGMTFEEGVKYALEWVIGEMSDEDFGYVNKY